MAHDFIFVYGPPGSGKSSLGSELARRLELPFYDLDVLIAVETGRSIPELFAAVGEQGFRQCEADTLAAVLGQNPGVVALGGGALLRAENRAKVETVGRVLCLEAGFETLLHRMENAAGQRPLLDGDTTARLGALLAGRAAHYGSFALRLDTSALDLEAASDEAQLCLGSFHVSGMGMPYDVRILPGNLANIGVELQRRGLHGPLALVSDANIAPLYVDDMVAVLEQVGYKVHPVILPPGEQHKTIVTLTRLWQGFLAGGLERRSTVIALGGGVIGDLAGFAAATYLRGIPWVAVPTSLLAMVDAALGGKTGADLPQGKNLVGAFHPPALVLADPQALDTLPDVELRNGLAEVVKHGVLDDPQLFDLCQGGWATVLTNRDEIVRRAMAVKLRVIVADPFERGRRALLNLGHTLGHAIEIASDFQVRHGEAVAIGMVHAARLSERRGIADAGLADRIATVLLNLGLPVRMPAGLERGRLLAAIGHDKKRSAGLVRLVLPVRIGEARWGVPLEDPVELLE